MMNELNPINYIFMRKLLLSLTLIVFVSGAYTQTKFVKIINPDRQPENIMPMSPDVYNPIFGGVPGAKKSFDAITIGTTWDDLQGLNWGNVMQRNWVYADGTLGSVWNSRGETGDPERGAGYNYWDGTEWGEPNPHVGPDDRMGTPCYAPWGPTGEIIAQYRYIPDDDERSIYLYKREVKGEGDWVEVEIEPPAGDYGIVWHAMQTSGENNEHIHLLAYVYMTEGNYNDQTSALLYYRSSDGGETWDIWEETIYGLGSDFLPSINSLSYYWANPVGSTIAFTYGFDEWGGRVFKSNDNGDTWEFFWVYETYYDPFDPPASSPNFGAGIGTSTMVLDSEGKAHVCFPRCVRYFAGADDGSAAREYYSDGLIYWNENMDALDTATISATTLEYLDEGGNLVGWIMANETYEIPADQPTSANPLCAYPQMSIDANDNIFVAYSSVAPAYSNGLVNFRHIVLNASFDGGATWEGQTDLNDDFNFSISECCFPMMAPVIGDYVQLTYQEDGEPGIAGWFEEHDPVENKIQHMMIEKATFVNVPEQHQKNTFEVSECYPNPAAANTMIQVKLEQAAEVDIRIVNVMGQVVMEYPSKVMQAGAHPVSLNIADLMSGIYYCIVETGHQKVTRKFVVK